jgi:hypothetical protein
VLSRFPRQLPLAGRFCWGQLGVNLVMAVLSRSLEELPSLPGESWEGKGAEFLGLGMAVLSRFLSLGFLAPSM